MFFPWGGRALLPCPVLLKFIFGKRQHSDVLHPRYWGVPSGSSFSHTLGIRFFLTFLAIRHYEEPDCTRDCVYSALQKGTTEGRQA